MSKTDDAKNSLKDCKDTLQKYLDDVTTATPLDEESLQLRIEYFNWTEMKTKLIDNEKNFILPFGALPNKINGYIYNYLFQDKKDVIDKYYQRSGNIGELVINIKKSDVPINDVELLIHNIILRRGNVIWVNFGFNIGREFRGKHPALILKNVKDTLIVLPLSSKPPNDPDISVKIDNVYGLPLKLRWGNILRIIPVSIMRIDFNSPIGSVKNDVLKDVSDKIKAHGIK